MRVSAEAAIALLIFAATLSAQQHTVPMGPQSGYDPFILNQSTGRFEYVPIPYDPEPVGNSYNPFRFNWHSGRWDYIPYPLPSDYDDACRQGTAWNYRDTRIDPRLLGARTIATNEPAPPIPTHLAPPPVNPHIAPPTTRATTQPSGNTLIADHRLARLRTIGRWDFNYARGRWIFILPSDQ